MKRSAKALACAAIAAFAGQRLRARRRAPEPQQARQQAERARPDRPEPERDAGAGEHPNRFGPGDTIAALDEAPDGRSPGEPLGSRPSSLPPG